MSLARKLPILFIAAACAQKAASPRTIGNQTAATATATATACPTGDVLAAIARTAWSKQGGVVTAQCVALRAGGETLWLIDGWFEPPESDEQNMVGSWTALVTPAGEVRWVDGNDDLAYGMMDRTTDGGWTATDLDGDGTDEAIHVSGYMHGGDESSSIAVISIIGGSVVWGEELALSSDNTLADPDPEELFVCDGTWEIVPGTPARIAVTREGPQCEAPGRHLYLWNGKALVETTP